MNSSKHQGFVGMDFWWRDSIAQVSLKKNLPFCSEDEQNYYGMTWNDIRVYCITDDRIFIFGWTAPCPVFSANIQYRSQLSFYHLCYSDKAFLLLTHTSTGLCRLDADISKNNPELWEAINCHVWGNHLNLSRYRTYVQSVHHANAGFNRDL